MPRLHAALATLTALAVLPTIGCFTVNGASSNAIPVVRVQASNDLDCPQKKITIFQRAGAQFEAIGCAHKATYNALCDGLRCTVAPQGQVVPWRARPDSVPSGVYTDPPGYPR